MQHKFKDFFLIVEQASEGNAFPDVRNPSVGSLHLMGDMLTKFSDKCRNAVTANNALPKSEIQVSLLNLILSGPFQEIEPRLAVRDRVVFFHPLIPLVIGRGNKKFNKIHEGGSSNIGEAIEEVANNEWGFHLMRWFPFNEVVSTNDDFRSIQVSIYYKVPVDSGFKSSFDLYIIQFW